jgi:hypothetical protein
MPKLSAITLKAWIGCGLYNDKKVASDAGGTRARQPMPRNAQRHPFLDSHRNVNRQCLFALDLAIAITPRTGLLNQLSPTPARRAGGNLLDGHAGIFPAGHALAGAATGVATLWLSARLCSRAMAGRTALPPGEPNGFFASRRHAFERNLDHDFEIFAARRARVSSTKKAVEEAPATAKTEIKPKTAEDFIEVDSAK